MADATTQLRYAFIALKSLVTKQGIFAAQDDNMHTTRSKASHTQFDAAQDSKPALFQFSQTCHTRTEVIGDGFIQTQKIDI